MSTYATEFEVSDTDDDEMFVSRCIHGDLPLMMFMAGGRYGIELYREDVERLSTYLASIVDTVPARPEPEPEPTIESVGAIRGGQILWTRQVCHNTLNITPKEHS